MVRDGHRGGPLVDGPPDQFRRQQSAVGKERMHVKVVKCHGVFEFRLRAAINASRLVVLSIVA